MHTSAMWRIAATTFHPQKPEKVQRRSHAAGKDATPALIGRRGGWPGKFLGRWVAARWGLVASRRPITAGRAQNPEGFDGAGITIGKRRSGDLGPSPLRTVEAAAMRLSPKARRTSSFGVREVRSMLDDNPPCQPHGNIGRSVAEVKEKTSSGPGRSIFQAHSVTESSYSAHHPGALMATVTIPTRLSRLLTPQGASKIKAKPTHTRE
jgi:hypothetical protein